MVDTMVGLICLSLERSTPPIHVGRDEEHRLYDPVPISTCVPLSTRDVTINGQY